VRTNKNEDEEEDQVIGMVSIYTIKLSLLDARVCRTILVVKYRRYSKWSHREASS
jgi:hypothetical protein